MSPHRPPLRIRARGLRDAALSLGALAALGSALGMAWAPLGWAFELLSHFRFQALAVCLILAAALGTARAFRPALGFFAAALVHAAVLLPWWMPSPQTPAAVPSPALRLTLLNLLVNNPNAAAVERHLRQENPDVLVLLEFTPAWRHSLESLRHTYPHRIEDARAGTFGAGIWSRVPFTQADTVHHASTSIPALRASFSLPQPWTLYAAHPVPPVTPASAQLRDSQIRDLAAWMRPGFPPVVLAADLNTTPWSPIYRELIRRTGLADSTRSRGWQPTWFGAGLAAALPIDHLLARPPLRLHGLRIGPDVGSDHRSVSALLVFPPPG